MLLKNSTPSAQPIPAFCPDVENAAAAARQSTPTALSPRPIVILTTSLGSGNRFAQNRQKATAANRNVTLTTASSAINQVVGMVWPKNTRLTWSGTQIM